jgi:hypothetical protein
MNITNEIKFYVTHVQVTNMSTLWHNWILKTYGLGSHIGCIVIIYGVMVLITMGLGWDIYILFNFSKFSTYCINNFSKVLQKWK